MSQHLVTKFIKFWCCKNCYFYFYQIIKFLRKFVFHCPLTQQALIIRFLESRGYEVNTSDLRPRILASAGIIGAELGHLSPSEIPRVAPGIMVSDTQVDAIVTELKSLAQAFKPKTETLSEVIENDEEIADAADRLKSAREKIDHIDDVLARLRG